MAFQLFFLHLMFICPPRLQKTHKRRPPHAQLHRQHDDGNDVHAPHVHDVSCPVCSCAWLRLHLMVFDGISEPGSSCGFPVFHLGELI